MKNRAITPRIDPAVAIHLPVSRPSLALMRFIALVPSIIGIKAIGRNNERIPVIRAATASLLIVFLAHCWDVYGLLLIGLLQTGQAETFPGISIPHFVQNKEITPLLSMLIFTGDRWGSPLRSYFYIAAWISILQPGFLLSGILRCFATGLVGRCLRSCRFSSWILVCSSPCCSLSFCYSG